MTALLARLALVLSVPVLSLAVFVPVANASEKCFEVAPVFVLGQQTTPRQVQCILWI